MKIKVGGSFDHYIKLTSININYEPLIWDTNDGNTKAYPMFMTVDLNGRIVHEQVPGADYDKWYRDSDTSSRRQPVGRSDTETFNEELYDHTQFATSAQTAASAFDSGSTSGLAATRFN